MATEYSCFVKWIILFVFGAQCAGCALRGMPLPGTPVSKEDRLVQATRQGSDAAKRDARRRLERYRFSRARKGSSVLGWLRYLRNHPRGLFAERARTRVALTRFAMARKGAQPEAYRWFLKRHGDHPLAAQIWRLLVRQLGRQLMTSGDRFGILAHLRLYPKSPLAPALKRRLETIDFKALHDGMARPDLESFLLRYPASKHRGAVRRRIAARIANQVGYFGDAHDLQRFEQRFAGSIQVGRIRRALALRRLTGAVLSFDVGPLRVLKARAESPRATKIRINGLLTWMRRHRQILPQLRELIRRALPWRPSGRLHALIAASSVSDPRTVAYALRALSYLPSRPGVMAIIRAVGSPDTAVSSAASDALLQWARHHGSGPARQLLDDEAAQLRPQAHTRARLTRAALHRARGDWMRVLALLAGKRWYRPWSVTPLYLWLMTLPGQVSPNIARIGKNAVVAYQDEARKLRQMIPKRIRTDNRAQAAAAVFELDRLARSASKIIERHGVTQAAWVGGVQRVVAVCRKHRNEGDRRLSALFASYESVMTDSFDQRRRQHERGRAAAHKALAAQLKGLRAPVLLVTTLCSQALVRPCSDGAIP